MIQYSGDSQWNFLIVADITKVICISISSKVFASVVFKTCNGYLVAYEILKVNNNHIPTTWFFRHSL